ncbi:hypothetical protein [uncultured Bifidobacterium sp.]|uniref:hypothetical protein n=1 Tax=uncultured Bifidobacterium sp. TaxID=165187 RepID=UPI002585E38D|nr:hypothetical protein [uncultured Bifidobacterium sp.]
MHRTLALGTTDGKSIRIALDDGQDATQLDNQLTQAVKERGTVTVNGTIPGSGADKVTVNPSAVMWWAIGAAESMVY